MPRTAFDEAYDALVGRWAEPVRSERVATRHGEVHLLESGPADAPTVVLLPGSGAGAPTWWSVAGPLATDHRVLAVDLLGDVGRSVVGPGGLRRPEQVVEWLEDVLEARAVDEAVVVGHSYGGWVALRHALERPGRIGSLVLLDPTACFTGMRPAYLLHALPALVAPRRGTRRYLAWETEGRGIDPDVLALWEAADKPSALVLPRRPSRADLQGLGVPVTLVLAERGRQHDPRRLR